MLYYKNYYPPIIWKNYNDNITNTFMIILFLMTKNSLRDTKPSLKSCKTHIHERIIFLKIYNKNYFDNKNKYNFTFFVLIER